ncbi:MAG: glycosyltransferase family 2 protein [Gemmatimonadota bacterium]|nr:glycosyltransferase family 2 protein [Gemmatimonadota bacterium]
MSAVSTVVVVALAPLAAIFLLPLMSDLAGVAVALPRRWRRRPGASGKEAQAARQRLCFLVPAHQERLLVGACVQALVRMTRARADADVYVIADNCTDDTAAIAAAAGARVLERRDLEKRGKPQAILWAMDQLPLGEYDAVVIIDADTVVEPAFADELAATGPLREAATQAYFGLSNEGDTWLSRLAGLLAAVRYEWQYPHKARAGLNCPLTGNGMCLGTAVLARSGWAPDSLTENWELYARYTALGETIRFAPGALLRSQEARTLAQSSTQRRRWQAGRWLALRDYWRPLLTSRRIGWRQKLDALAELSAPGPVVHAAVAGAAGAGLMLLPGRSAQVLGAIFWISLAPIAGWTAAAWARHPDRGELLVAMVRLPFYAIWRLAVAALAVSTGRRGAWHRSPRHSPEAR